jgi:hypothetical protein
MSTSYHGSKVRVLQDLPVQGSPVSLRLRQARWRCRNPCCARKTFVTPLPESAPRFARRTRRVTDLALLLVHAAGGRPAERLMKRLGLSQSDDTLLRSLKHQTANNGDPTPVRVVGIDDWSWLKGASYGTIMVDLERREVLDVLADRSADGTAAWLACRPEVEIISRDRCGLYAEGATRGAPQAGQVADRFHLIQNLRQSIQQQLSRAPLQQEPFAPGEMEPEPQQPQPGLIHRYGQPEVTEHRRLANAGRRAARRSRFDQLKILQATGKGLSEIVRETGLNWRTVAKWTRLDILPERGIMAPKPTTPNHFRKYLAQRWAEGCTFGRQTATRGDQTARLHRKPDSLAAAAQNMAPGALRGDGGGSVAVGICVAANHFLRGRGCAVYQTPGIADGATGGESRLAEGDLSGLRDDAPTRHAVPRHFARAGHGKARCVAG